MISDAIIWLGLLATGVWFWLDSARAREIATALAASVCRRHGFQFLDGTAALAALGLRWTRQGVRLRRVFSFDYSEAGVGRHTGHLVLLGMELEEFSLGLPGDGNAAVNPGPGGGDDESHRLPPGGMSG